MVVARLNVWLVKLPIYIFVLINFVSPLSGASIEVEIKDEAASVNQELKGKIKLIADEGEEVDEKSFYLGSKPLNVKLVGRSRSQSIQIIGNQRKESIQHITIYEFDIDGQEEGLHMLPPVKVKVGGEDLISENISYQIRNGKEIRGFFIESAIEGPNPIYPGQKAYLVYRIYYQFPVELVSEFLPLLYPERGFKALDDPQFSSYKDRSYQVTEAKVFVEALEAGEYNFAPAIIEGYHYTTNFFGRKRYIPPQTTCSRETFFDHSREFSLKKPSKSIYRCCGKLSNKK